MLKSFQSTLLKSSLKAVSSSSLCFRRNLAHKTLFISNIPWTFRKTDIHNLVAPHGPIYEISYPKGEDGHYRGFAFVKLNEEAVEGAIAKLNGIPCEDRVLRVIENKLTERVTGTPKDKVQTKGDKKNSSGKSTPTKSTVNQALDATVQEAVAEASTEYDNNTDNIENQNGVEATGSESVENADQSEASETTAKLSHM
ncbi:hypothetical protein DSO57_1000595 [Entomophthora muscae]|uniref:Uncharacterized protein n=1 Tax=Entomophthora muscae TaxID=34485 RepID=A0ACC2S0B2_9FUNG|nr:hypothetical protein DSO57_1000595 [Entomophthora muscae]